MKAISIPFRFESGKVAETSDITDITEKMIIDILTTGPGDRAINIGYGVNIKSLLYEPLDSLAFDDFKVDAISAINEFLESGKVVDITVSYPDSPQMAYTEDSTISVSVRYIVPPYNGRSFTFNVSSDI